MVVALVMHGDPRIDEPLEIAWRRALHRLGLNGGPPENLAGELRKVLSDQLPVDVDALKEKFVSFRRRHCGYCHSAGAVWMRPYSGFA